MLTVFGEQVFGGDGSGGQSGILYSMRGLGTAIGPILAWRVLGDEPKGMYRAIGSGWFLCECCFLLFFLSGTDNSSRFCLCPLCPLRGAVQWVFSTSLLHRYVDDNFRGRVFFCGDGSHDYIC